MDTEQKVKTMTSTNQAVMLTVGMVAAFFVGLSMIFIMSRPIAQIVEEPAPVIKPGLNQVAGWPQTVSGYGTAIPLAVNLDNDTQLEIIRGTRGTVYAYNADGTVVKGWPYSLGSSAEAQASFIGSPTYSTSIDDDPEVEIVFATFRWYGDGASKIYAVNHNGTLVDNFPINLPNDAKETPAVGDINGDGYDEIVVSVPRENKLYAYSHDGQMLSGWPKDVSSYSWAHPVIADMNSDGIDDVVYGSANNIYVFSSVTVGPPDPSLSCWPYQIDNPAPSSPNYVSQVAVGDITQDGFPEIVFAVSYGDDPHTEMMAINSNCTVVKGWPISINTISDPMSNYVPVLGDVDGDLDVEVVFSEGPWDPTAGPNKIHVWNHDGTELAGWPVEVFGGVQKPSLMDLNGDKKLDIVYGDGSMIYAKDYLANDVHYFPFADQGGGVMQVISADVTDNNNPELIVANYGNRMNLYTLTGISGTDGYYWPQYQHDSKKSGAIYPSIVPTCNDTDPNNDIYVKGQTSGINWYGASYTSEDTCYGVNDEGIGTQIGQYYCYDNPNGAGQVSGQRVSDCENGCSADAGTCTRDVDIVDPATIID